MNTKIVVAGILGIVASTNVHGATYLDPTVLNIENADEIVTKRYKIDQLRIEYENVSIRTRNPWTRKEEFITYRGPKILDVLQRHQLDRGDSVQFVAYDNFSSEITMSEIRTYDPIFAIDRACENADRKSGRCTKDQVFTPLSPEEQGPIFLVWPFDKLPPGYVPMRNSIWVWFVVAVRPSL